MLQAKAVDITTAVVVVWNIIMIQYAVHSFVGCFGDIAAFIGRVAAYVIAVGD